MQIYLENTILPHHTMYSQKNNNPTIDKLKDMYKEKRFIQNNATKDKKKNVNGTKESTGYKYQPTVWDANSDQRGKQELDLNTAGLDTDFAKAPTSMVLFVRLLKAGISSLGSVSNTIGLSESLAPR